MGTMTINLQDSPAFGCLIGPTTKKFPYLMGFKFPSAVKAGEMVRSFPTRYEHTTFVMMQIVNKLHRTRSLIGRECRDEMMGLYNFLIKTRSDFRSGYHQIPGRLVESFLSVGLEEDLLLWTKIPAISSVYRKLDTYFLSPFYHGDPFLVWETLKLLVGFLTCSTLHFSFHKNFDRLDVKLKEDLSKEDRELFDELGNSAQFEEMWDSVLAALKSGLVDHSNLLDILCGGSREQMCHQCRKQIIIERVFVLGTDEPEAMYEESFVTFRRRIFSCSEMDCQVAGKKKESDFLSRVDAVLRRKIMVDTGLINRCDYCAGIDGSVHRCSQCKTKVYCSEECQQLDWAEVHHKICKEGEVTRKVKPGRKGRDKWGRENDDELAPLMKQIWIDNNVMIEKDKAMIDEKIKSMNSMSVGKNGSSWPWGPGSS